MNETNEALIHRICLVLMQYSSIEKAFVFGSRARGDYQSTSDLDLALMSLEPIPPRLRLDLDDAVGIYKIDVIDFNHLENEALQQRILKEGHLIYTKGKKDLI